MKRYTYTKREVQIIKTKRPLTISDEEFLSLYHKAFMRNNIKHINHLGNVYPEMEHRVFSVDFEKRHIDPADREGHYSHPILCPTNRYTEERIKDMVCYLTGTENWPASLRRQLHITVHYRLVFNYWLDEYVKDFDVDALWNAFFLGQADLSKVIELRGITGLDVLVYRAMEYYDRYTKSSCAECGIGDWKEPKSHTARCVRKRASANFCRGLGYPQQAKLTHLKVRLRG